MDLRLATQSGHWGVVQLLTEVGADVDVERNCRQLKLCSIF